ncbi:unnamed protein product [Cylindrotheca closterium]|uniref:Uncharacterized protein n=1 Tax=Cylindrotheca closterium TaxID=2856 RepID=A0AAD2FRL1_9STRA|nr:unnamed protein product [Cylindrotheca closterium]
MMPLMQSIRRSKSPKRDVGQDSSAIMLSPVESESSSSFANTGNDDYELEAAPPQSQSSQIKKLKKVFLRNPVHADSNDSLSRSNRSLSTSLRGEEVFRIAINEDSIHEDSSIPCSPRWQRTVGAVEKPPSIKKLDTLLAMGESYSESEDEGHSSRRSTIRTSVDDDMNMDDSTHPIPALAPPSLSDLTTVSSKVGNKSTKSIDTATTMQMSELSFRNGKPKSSLTSYGGDSYSAANSAKAFWKNASSRANLDQPNNESFTSRTSTIRSAVEQSLEESTHALPPLQKNRPQGQQPSIAELSNDTSTSSRQRRSDIDLSLDGESTHALLATEPPTLLPSAEESSATTSVMGRKSRSPGPASNNSGTCKSRQSPARARSGNRVRSSKSPHKNSSDPAILQQIIQPNFDPCSPSLRGERKVLEGSNERGERFTVRRTVSSPVHPGSRKQLLPKPEERGQRMRRSITAGTLERDLSQSPSRPRGSRSVLAKSMKEEVSERRGVGQLRGSLLDRSRSDNANMNSDISERGIQSIDTRDFPGVQVTELTQRNAVRSSSPGLRFRNVSRQTTRTEPIDKRKSHSTRAERSIPIDMDSDADEETPLRGESKTFHSRQCLSFETESGDESLHMNDYSLSPRGKVGPIKGLLLKRSGSDGGIRPSMSERGDRTAARRNSTGLRLDLAGMRSNSRSKSPGFRLFGNSARQTRTVPIDEDKDIDPGEKSPSRLGTKVKDKIKSLKEKSISLRGKRSIEVEVDDEKPKLQSLSSSRETRSVDLELDGEMPTLKNKSSRRERRSIDLELDGEKPNLKSKSSRREKRSIDFTLDEDKPKLKNKSSRRERRSIDLELNEDKPKLNKSSRRERRSIDVEVEEEKGKKSKSSRRERRSIDVALDEESDKKSKSSRRERRSIDLDLDEASSKKSKSSRRERRTLSIDLDFGSDKRKEKSKKSKRRTYSVDSGDSLNFESSQPKGQRSLLTETLEDIAETPARVSRSRSRKKVSPKNKSKSPKGKASSKIEGDGNETSSTFADAGDISVDGPSATKSRPGSPSSLFRKLKGIRSERYPKNVAGRSYSPKKVPSPSKNRKLTRLSIS